MEFLELAIELRVKHLIKKIDPRFVTSANVVNRRLKLPLQCPQDIDALEDTQAIHAEEFTRELLRIELVFFRALETQ